MHVCVRSQHKAASTCLSCVCDLHARVTQVGIAHVADMDAGIPDPDVRAGCERRALCFGRTLLVTPAAFPTVDSLVAAAVAAAQP